MSQVRTSSAGAALCGSAIRYPRMGCARYARRGNEMGRRTAVRGDRFGAVWITAMVVASLAIPIAAPVAPVDAQTNSTCLDVKNNRSDTISVAVVGFKEDTSYWLFAPGES